MGFSRQECWSGLPCPPPPDLPHPGIEPSSLMSPALQVGSLPPRNRRVQIPGVAKSWIRLKQLRTHREPQLNVGDLVLSLERKAPVQLQVAKGSVPDLRAAEGRGHGGAKTSRRRRLGAELSGHPSLQVARPHRASPSLQLTWSRFWSWIPWSTWKHWSA